MKTIYIDCTMGAAGDMLTAALIDLFKDEEKEKILEELNNIGIPGVRYVLSRAEKCGIGGAAMEVWVNGRMEGEEEHRHGEEHHHKSEHLHGEEHHHESEHRHGEDHQHEEGYSHIKKAHTHTGMHRIEEIVRSIRLPEKVRKDLLCVYGLLADAESRVHGVPVEEIHFHEVGNMDAVADIAAVCLLIDRLSPDMIMAGRINTGSGTVRCSHGVLPVPAPATAELLKGLPIYNDGISTELTTPTGAALLRYFVKEFGDMPEMKVSSIGYGMGKKELERANCIRVFMGEEAGSEDRLTDRVAELSCNIDDMTGEEMGFALEALRKAGALDVWTSSIQMKKSRPGTLLSLLCREEDRERFAELIFNYTSTLGVRETLHKRYVLKREILTEGTPEGPVRVKRSEGYGVTKEKREWEDIAKQKSSYGASSQGEIRR